MPRTEAGSAPLCSSTARAPVQTACHQSSGFCSAQPFWGCAIGYSTVLDAATCPSVSNRTVFVPEVPMSIPSKYSTDFALLQTMTGYSTVLPQARPCFSGNSATFANSLFLSYVYIVLRSWDIVNPIIPFQQNSAFQTNWRMDFWSTQ